MQKRSVRRCVCVWCGMPLFVRGLLWVGKGHFEGCVSAGTTGGGEARCAASGAAEICTALIATRADRERLLE